MSQVSRCSHASALPSAAKGKEESLSVQGLCVSNNRVDVIDWLLFPFVLVDPRSLHTDWLTGKVYETTPLGHEV